jgi:hypothetical protein
VRGLEFLMAFFVSLGLGIIYFTVIPGGEMVIMVGAIALTIFYYITGIGLPRNSVISKLKQAEPAERIPIFIRSLAGLTFSLSVLTILWNEMYWQGFQMMLYVDVTLLTIVMFIDIYYLEKSIPELFRFIMLRSVIFSAFTVFYVITPLERRLSWKYDDQYYIELLQYAIENPHDKDAKRNLKEYEAKSRGEFFLDDGEDYE